MRRSQLLSVLAVLAPATVRAADAPTPADLVHQLQAANTASERIAVLKDDSDFVFNFLDPKNKATSGAGGKAVASNIGNFPALFGSGMAMTLGFMEPCSLNSPHTHPRATEVLIMINGTIESGFLAENGARFVMNTVEKLEATVFPRGSIHFQANLGCEPVMFAAALNHEDPGTLQVAQRFFALPGDVVGAALGGIGVQEVAELAKFIPDNLIQATDSCFTKCGLTPPAKGSQPTKQQQAPVATTSSDTPTASDTPIGNGDGKTFEGNGTPPNWLGAGQEAGSAHDPSTNAPGPAAAGDSGSEAPKHNVLAADGGSGNDLDQAKDAAKGWFEELPHDGDKIAVLALVVLNVAMLIGAIVFFCVRASRQRKLRKNRGLDTMSIAGNGNVSSHGTGHMRNISGPKPLITSSRGKYAAAEFELPPDDSEVFTARKYDDPYDKPASRAPSPMPAAHTGPYRD